MVMLDVAQVIIRLHVLYGRIVADLVEQLAVALAAQDSPPEAPEAHKDVPAHEHA